MPSAMQLNHLAMTVSRDDLTQENRDAIIKLFGECLGFREWTPWTSDRKLLSLYFSARDEIDSPHDADVTYIVFIGHDEPATANAGNMGDHVGINLPSYAEWEECLNRLRAAAETDDRVVVGEPEVLTSEHEREHRFYFRFIAPVALELQFQEQISA